MASTKNSPIGNVLLVGPSGCGKTKLVSELALISGLPMKVIDASKLSGAGWVGGDIDTLLIGFRLQCKKNKQTHAIVFIDEADKIANSSENSKHNTSEVQEMLLSEIDGYGGSRVKILYIFAGVFNGLKKIKSNKISRSIGFTAKLPSTIVKREMNEELQDEDLIDSGLSAEFVGRIGKIARLHSLTENEKISLLKKEGSIIGKYKEIFKELGVELRIAPKAIEDLVYRTKNTTTGVRGLEKEIATLIEPHLLTIGTKKTINIVSDKADKTRRKK
jgi:ATP-dependent protease Clp ATPase subunit